ncbi:alpha/beta hydrolase, partial [Nocardioides guangzhouensis]
MIRPDGRRLRRGLFVALLLPGTVMAMLWALQRQLIYFPDP